MAAAWAAAWPESCWRRSRRRSAPRARRARRARRNKGGGAGAAAGPSQEPEEGAEAPAEAPAAKPVPLDREGLLRLLEKCHEERIRFGITAESQAAALAEMVEAERSFQEPLEEAEGYEQAFERDPEEEPFCE